MATTNFGALSAAQNNAHSSQVWKVFREKSFWFNNGFLSSGEEDMTKPVQRITTIEGGNGDGTAARATMHVVNDLEGDGVVGDNQLTGNEEALTNGIVQIQVDQIRNGVKSAGKMSEQKTVIRFRAQARDKLGHWLPDKIDELMFLTASGRPYTLRTDGSTRPVLSQLPSLSFAGDVTAPTANRLMHAGTATSEASLTSSDKMTWDMVVRARTYAHRRGVKPIREGGKEYYVLVVSSEQRRDLVTDPSFKQIVSNAAARGTNNPLFTNAEYVIDGVVIHSHNKVFNTFGLAAGSKWGLGGAVDGAQALLLGSQALGFASPSNNGGEWAEADITDYGNQPGIGYRRTVGIKKPVVRCAKTGTNEDFGVVSVKTAAALAA